MKPIVFVITLTWSLLSNAAIAPDLASTPHDTVCESLVALKSKTMTGVEPGIIEGLVKSGLVDQLSPTDVYHLENEISFLYPAAIEGYRLERELARLDRRLPRLEARTNSNWRYFWTLSWAGTGAYERGVRKLESTRQHQQHVAQQLSEIELRVNRYHLLLRDAADRFQSSPRELLNLTDEGRELVKGLQVFRGVFPQKSVTELQSLIVTMDLALTAYQLLQNASVLNSQALPAYLAAHIFANAEIEDLESVANELRRQSDVQPQDEPSLLLTAFQFQKEPAEVVRVYEVFRMNNFIRSSVLAAPLTSITFRHQLEPQTLKTLWDELQSLDRFPRIPPSMMPGLLSASLSAQHGLSESLSDARQMLNDIGDSYQQQIPSLLLATWKSGRSLKEVGDLVLSFRNDHLSIPTDAAGLATLVLNTGLQKQDLMAIYHHVQSQSLQSASHAGPVTAIILGQALSDWGLANPQQTTDDSNSDASSPFPFLMTDHGCFAMGVIAGFDPGSFGGDACAGGDASVSSSSGISN